MVSDLYIIGPKLSTHRQALCKAIFVCLGICLVSTHFNNYSTSVAISQQGLENLKNTFLIMLFLISKTYK